MPPTFVSAISSDIIAVDSHSLCGCLFIFEIIPLIGLCELTQVLRNNLRHFCVFSQNWLWQWILNAQRWVVNAECIAAQWMLQIVATMTTAACLLCGNFISGHSRSYFVALFYFHSVYVVLHIRLTICMYVCAHVCAYISYDICLQVCDQ